MNMYEFKLNALQRAGTQSPQRELCATYILIDLLNTWFKLDRSSLSQSVSQERFNALESKMRNLQNISNPVVHHFFSQRLDQVKPARSGSFQRSYSSVPQQLMLSESVRR
jgi:hypothetical protein